MAHSSELAIPGYYQPGAILDLQLDSSPTTFSVEVLYPITPFTMGQIIVAKALKGITTPFGLPQHDSSFVVKVYDPRYFSNRATRNRPWTLAGELEAARIRESEAAPLDIPDWGPDDDDLTGREEWYYRHAEDQYESERKAYQLLAPLQGSSIPKYFASGKLLGLSDRAIVPHINLIEFIPDAKTAETVGHGVVDPSICRSLINAVKEFGKFGVVHHDFHLNNIFFTPGDRPTRGVIIDFGSAGFRFEGESDEDWWNAVVTGSDVPTITNRLKRYVGFLDS